MILRGSARLGAALTLALLASASLPGAASAQSRPRATATSVAAIASLPAFIDGVVAQQIATREVAGAVVTVVQDGRIVMSRGYGFADVDRGITVDPATTLFRPGSVSKLFTWTALMQQIEQGRVRMDDDVNTYLDFKIPAFEGKPVTVRDLFQHTPGMSDSSGISTGDPAKVEYFTAWMKTHIPRRIWAPGTETSYSNYGAALAGYIVEKVSGVPFADYAERNIFRPLGMKTTTFREDLAPSLRQRAALGYKVEGGRFVAQPVEYYGVILPAGSASAPGDEMARFMLAMLGGGQLNGVRILKPQSVKLLMSDSFANVAGLPGMAHGFMVRGWGSTRLVGHGGNTRDFHSDLVLAPDRGFGIFISMTGGEGSYGARTELADAVLGRMFPQSASVRQAGPAPRYVGSYRTNRRDYALAVNPDRDLKVSVAGPSLLKLDQNGRTSSWQRIGADTYEQVTGARQGGPYDRLRFYGDGRDPRLSFASQPHVTYHFVKS
ncbi:beta-lactamase family protein [Sphingomonas aliaeris]|uniref:Beta-lactamase family protein n=1 Tax=Sphingomonas aliaeris TaxID=2759526 RepID=A0A974S2X0_9SPHN|nr:serine hydrolase domain-containing protein [Sphingomonas aliaeris]QQV75958.1 beta-lactamase family protein [Sphingomonas aliaeris]